MLSKDGERLYYLTSFEKGNDLWVTEVRTRETKLFNKLGANTASMELSPDGKFLFVIADGKRQGRHRERRSPSRFRSTTEMVLDYSAEKEYIFDHSWRQFKQKLIFPDLTRRRLELLLHDVQKFLPYINNNYDFAEMLSEMLGEMNVSHTGRATTARTSPTPTRRPHSGCSMTSGYTGDGVKVAEVLQGGPVDLAASTIKTGHIIEAIDGTDIDAAMDFYKLLNRKAGKFTLLSVYDPASNKRWEETVKPVDGAAKKASCYTNAGCAADERKSISCPAAKSVTSTSVSNERCEHARRSSRRRSD